MPDVTAWMSVSPQSHMLKPNIKGDSIMRGAFGRWSGHEADTPWMGLVFSREISLSFIKDIQCALIKEPPERSPFPLAMWRFKENSITWKKVLTQQCWHPDLGLPSSRTVRNNFFCLQATLFVVFCYSC